MAMKSYKAKKSKNPRGIVIGVFQVLGSLENLETPGRGGTIPLKPIPDLDVERLYI